MGARIPNMFGFWMVGGIRWVNGFEQNACHFVWISNGLEQNGCRFVRISNAPEDLKTDPFKNRILKRSVFEWVLFSRVQNLSHHCMLLFWIMKEKIFTNYRRYIFKEPGNNLLVITMRIKHCITVTLWLPDTWITNSICFQYSNGKVTWRDLADHLNTGRFRPKTDFFSPVSDHHMNTRPFSRTQIY